MILIADSGSTKTDWALLSSSEKARYFTTEGYNPYFSDKIDWSRTLALELTEKETRLIRRVFYYGAGCNCPENTEEVIRKLREMIPGAAIDVGDDLTGAARGLWQNDPGIIAILGTGTNVGFYDGRKVVDQVIPMGYVLGDHGSGAVLGKRLLQEYYCHTLPDAISASLDKAFSMDPWEIKKQLYHSASPNHYLAGFVPFLVEHQEAAEIRQLIQEAFLSFFRYQILPLLRKRKTAIRLTGSVAYLFRDILSEAGKIFSVEIDRIERFPIHQLCAYYRQTLFSS